MLAILAAFGSALCFGASDFIGGIASRRAPVVAVTALTYITATVAYAVSFLIVPSQWSIASLGYGLGAGLTAIFGMVGFYAALASGPIALMSPLIALIQTLLPVLYGVIVLREQLQLHHWAGIALAMLAAWMISGARLAATRIPARSVLLAIMAGSMFATSLIFLDSSPAESGMTPGFVEMVLGMLLLGLLAIGASRHRRVFALTSRVDPQPPTTPTAPVPDLRVTVTALGAGLIMGTASILVLLALRTGPLALVTAISALYPLSTVALAAVVLRESVRPGQAVGIVLAVSACVLLSL